MGRKVSVGLEADVAGFLRPVLESAKATENLDDKIKDVDRSLNKIPADAAKAGAALKLLAGDVDSVGSKVNSLGEKSTGLAVLDAKIREAQKEVRKLADEFQRTGDIDVFRKLGDASGRLDGLKAVRKKLADAIVITPEEAKGVFKHLGGIASQVGTETGKVFSGGLIGALSTPVLGPIIAVALAAAIVAAAGMVFANAGGLILGAAGAGAIGLGIAGAIMGDPKAVGGAWSAEIDKLKDDWLAASTVFRGPTIEAAHEFGAVFANLHLDAILAKAASYMPALTAGAAGLTKNLGGAFESLVNGAGPAVKVLGAELPKIGAAIKVAADSIASGGEGGAQALKDLLQVVETVIVGIGRIIGVAEKAYDSLAKFRDFVLPDSWRWLFGLHPDAGGFQAAGRAIEQVGHSAMLSADNLKALSSELNTTKITADSLAGEMVGKIFSATMGLDQATLAWHSSLLAVGDALKKNGKDLHDNTEKGIANREAILASVTANMQIYQAQLAAGMSAADAAANYDVNTAALEKQLRKAGLTQAAIDGLIGKYKGVPAEVNTNIAMNGLESAIRQLNETIRLINGLHDKTITLTVKQVGDNPKGQSRGGGWATGGIRRAQVGMILPPSDPGTVLAAEPQTGGEALIPFQGISQGRAMSLMQQVGAGYGLSVSASHGGLGGTGNIGLTIATAPGGSNLDQAMSSWFMGAVRTGQIQITAKKN